MTGPIILTGATGMLGSRMRAALAEEDVVTLDRAYLDVSRSVSLVAQIAERKPRAIVNCAAHVDADAAESDPDPVYAANALLPQLLGCASRKLGIPLLHFSSTGCYGNWKETPYHEEDAVRPTTVHHATKVAGENLVRESGCEFLIIRTGWLFGGRPGHRKNFVWRRLEEAAATRALTSDMTQRGCPTFVDDLVDQALFLLRSGVRGLYNAVNHGSASRFEYVSKIVELANLPCRVVGTGVPFDRPAPVSPNEMAVNRRLGLLGLDRMTHWHDALARYLASMSGSPDWFALMGTTQCPAM
jgi:dTDP-4-dehydrorhamnose reductase